ncbi:hypothetical protein OIO90_005156 [Microbotryomycetes sp. JL221]|nr:hypothetical protein OIO90_005156 [Microbotryomycetes sp. JL221]
MNQSSASSIHRRAASTSAVHSTSPTQVLSQPPPPPQSNSSKSGKQRIASNKHARTVSTTGHWNDLPEHVLDPSVDGSQSTNVTPTPQHRRAISVISSSVQSSPGSNTSTLALVPEEDEDSAGNGDGDVVAGTSPSASLSRSTDHIGLHSRGHSRIHERNLSAFFPRPGQTAQGYGNVFVDPHQSQTSSPAPMQEIPSSSPSDGSPSRTRSLGRRGHHHRHSVSHNYLPFLGDEARSDINSLSRKATASSNALPQQARDGGTPLSTLERHNLRQARHDDVRSGLVPSARMSLRERLSVVAASLQIVVGSALWISGQNRESLAVTSLGYLVVFDGLGALGTIFVERQSVSPPGFSSDNDRPAEFSLRQPFGDQRIVTLSHFSQAIYLLFSAIYVCKESVEHVLLLHGASEGEGAHGSGHGGMGHGDLSLVSLGQDNENGITFPLLLLLAAACFSFFLSAAIGAHHQLAQSLEGRAHRAAFGRASSSPHLLGNQFTGSVFGLSVFLLLCGLSVPSVQLAPLDKVLALMESILMFLVSGPVAVATGQVLLQTAPDEHTEAFTLLQRAFQDIEGLPHVIDIKTWHVWQPIVCAAASSVDKCASQPVVVTMDESLFVNAESINPAV